jgi:6-phosphofructokinase 1
MAVKFATGGQFANGSTAIKRNPGKQYQVWVERTELKNVAKETRHMPDEFINAAGNDVTPAFVAYAQPIVGDLPKTGRLKAVPVAKAS